MELSILTPNCTGVSAIKLILPRRLSFLLNAIAHGHCGGARWMIFAQVTLINDYNSARALYQKVVSFTYWFCLNETFVFTQF